jgi:hypothetical protein
VIPQARRRGRGEPTRSRSDEAEPTARSTGGRGGACAVERGWATRARRHDESPRRERRHRTCAVCLAPRGGAPRGPWAASYYAAGADRAASDRRAITCAGCADG